jgi:4-amino-4-deoxy-L-arabinose transferase-like glycosyltransferase
MKETIGDLAGKPWMPYLWLALITLLGAAIRLYKLGEWSFWIDEVFTVNHALAHFSTPDLILDNIPPARNWVPVSVMLTAQSLNAWGVSEWSARIASAVIGILTFPLLYIPTKRFAGNYVALLALLILAISPWHVFWSQNARFYTSLMLFYMLALFALHLGIEEDKPGYLLLFFILVYIAASERLTALFIFPVVITYLAALWLMKFERPRGLNLRNLAIIALPVVLGGIVEIYTRIAVGESRFFADFTWFTQYQIDDPARLLVFVGNNIGIPLAVMAFFSSVAVLRSKSRFGLLMAVSAMVPLFVLLMLNLFIFTKDRYIFITLFSWIILAGMGVIEVASVLKANHRLLMFGFCFVFIAHAANELLLYYQANEGNRLQWKSAFSLVADKAESEDVVVAFWPEFGPYYLRREITSYEDLDPGVILESGKRYWFVLDSETIWTNGKAKTWLENNGELIEVWYLRRPENNFLRVYFFDPDRVVIP